VHLECQWTRLDNRDTHLTLEAAEFSSDLSSYQFDLVHGDWRGGCPDWQEISLRRDTRIYTYASRILENTEPNTLIVNHWPTASVFDYIQWIEGKRLDVQIFNLDFYFLAIQKDCKIENDQASLKTWYKWLDDKLERQPLCFIEPLPPIPANLSWQKKDECWGLTDTVDS
jgi:hypothetical protein